MNYLQPSLFLLERTHSFALTLICSHAYTDKVEYYYCRNEGEQEFAKEAERISCRYRIKLR